VKDRHTISLDDENFACPHEQIARIAVLRYPERSVQHVHTRVFAIAQTHYPMLWELESVACRTWARNIGLHAQRCLTHNRHRRCSLNSILLIMETARRCSSDICARLA
jgi:hypothetical protein